MYNWKVLRPIVAAVYRKNGRDYTVETIYQMTGIKIPPSTLSSYTSKEQIHVNPAVARQLRIRHTLASMAKRQQQEVEDSDDFIAMAKRQNRRCGVPAPAGLSKLDRLALYQPWRKGFAREIHEADPI